MDTPHDAEGLYEDVVTLRLLERLERLEPAAPGDLRAELGAVDEAEAPAVLARHLHPVLLRALREATPDSRVDLVRRVLDLIDEADEAPEPAPRQLLALTRVPGPGVVARLDTMIRPTTGLRDAALLTNAPGDPGLGPELAKELATADSVDLLCAFVKWHGIRVLETQLARLAERGATFRIITTTYMGNTERQALDRLAQEFGAQIRVQYDALRTRLHAKAWLFRRDTGHDTAYVGSSNLSRAALLDGAEWNVRLSRTATPDLLTKFEATFETYWNASGFEPYRPGVDQDRLDDALAVASGAVRDRVTLSLSGLQVRPFPHQSAILEALQSERQVHDRHRNLVVAATGTGKTVIAALDYQRLCDGTHRPRLLFVAHRAEILTQSLRTYREVLADPTFGEVHVGGRRPERWQHVFASIQSLTAYGVTAIPPDAFDVVVIDEFHHAQARTYRTLLEHLRPAELLGLTATPERGDGTDVREMFDGRTAAELRLWEAIDTGLLCPFHYFGIADGTDLTRVAWTSGRYDAQGLDAVYTGNDARARLILHSLEDKVDDPLRMRALGFCVSVAHARYMADVFTRAGIAALAVTGATPAAEREQAVADLQAGRVQVLFAVDVFNEGLDVPSVDTLLLLRPTDSPTVFLQQLGRGLRATPDKPVLTVLDFVGAHRTEFRLDRRFTALAGTTRRTLQRDVESGFPFLPSGCQIVLDEVTQDSVLTSVRDHLRVRRDQLAASLRARPTDALADFLHDTGLELSDVVNGRRTFTQVRQDAGLTAAGSPMQAELLRRLRALTHVDDPDRARAYRDLLAAAATESGRAAIDQVYARMLYYTFFPAGRQQDPVAGLEAVRAEADVRREAVQVIDLALDATRHTPRGVAELPHLPLAVHARYQREEILAALGYANPQRLPSHFREGVVRVDTPDGVVDALFVTLRKSDKDYSPTTMYADYPISPVLFHWETQSRVTTDSETGRRYLTGASTVLLFVRRDRENEFGTAPYTFLGPAEYQSHSGERPIAIVWRLRHRMPADLYAETAVAI